MTKKFKKLYFGTIFFVFLILVLVVCAVFFKNYNDFSFIVLGHLYGRASSPVKNKPDDLFPSASVLANIDLLKKDESSFLILNGDIVHKANQTQFDFLKSSFLEKIGKLFFIVVGNHEMQDRSLYEKNFGKTFFSFAHKNSFFVFLDTEINQGFIEGEQWDFFIKSIHSVSKNDRIKNVFILSHKIIWEKDFFDENFRPKEDIFRHFEEKIMPKLVFLAQEKRVLWISGDGMTPLYFKESDFENLSFVTTSLSETAMDNFLRIVISDDKKPFLEPVFLNGDDSLPIERYDKGYWGGWRANYSSEGVDAYWER